MKWMWAVLEQSAPLAGGQAAFLAIPSISYAPFLLSGFSKDSLLARERVDILEWGREG